MQFQNVATSQKTNKKYVTKIAPPVEKKKKRKKEIY